MIEFSEDNGWHQVFLDDLRVASFYYFFDTPRKIQIYDIFEVYNNEHYFEICITDIKDNQYFGKILRNIDAIYEKYLNDIIKSYNMSKNDATATLKKLFE